MGPFEKLVESNTDSGITESLTEGTPMIFHNDLRDIDKLTQDWAKTHGFRVNPHKSPMIRFIKNSDKLEAKVIDLYTKKWNRKHGYASDQRPRGMDAEDRMDYVDAALRALGASVLRVEDNPPGTKPTGRRPIAGM